MNSYFPALLRLSSAVLLATITLLPSVSLAEGRDQSVIPGRYIVVLKNGSDSIDQSVGRIQSRHKKISSAARFDSVLRGFVMSGDDASASALANDPEVASVIPDRLITALGDDRPGKVISEARGGNGGSTPGTLAQTLPTGVDRINAENKSNKGSGVGVAVIDTGILATHPDLSGAVVGGYNCTGGSTSNTTDQNGHGTHVAGTIAARTNTLGVVGVAPLASLWAIKVLDASGSGSWSSVICGLNYVDSRSPARGGSIKVANMSLGGAGTSDNNCGRTNKDLLHQAICKVRDDGVTVVVAAGNSSANASQMVPAAYDDAVITVSALADSDGGTGGLGSSTGYGADDAFASFSNFGSVVDLAAPGVSILSTWIGNTYATLSGTSMATPHVAGAAALYKATHPTASWTAVRSALVSAGELAGAGHTNASNNHAEPVVRADSL